MVECRIEHRALFHLAAMRILIVIACVAGELRDWAGSMTRRSGVIELARSF
jgi:hypothetical protein